MILKNQKKSLAAFLHLPFLSDSWKTKEDKNSFFQWKGFDKVRHKKTYEIFEEEKYIIFRTYKHNLYPSFSVSHLLPHIIGLYFSNSLSFYLSLSHAHIKYKIKYFAKSNQNILSLPDNGKMTKSQREQSGVITAVGAVL